MESVIVVHGLWMPGWETVLLRRRLRAAGFAPLLFCFATVGEGLQTNAERLRQFATRAPGETVHFVGYSLGGVVTVRMLETWSFERPGRVVCLGSPLNGSRSAHALARWPGGTRALGKSVLELNAVGGLPPWSSERELGIIAGRLAVGLGRMLGALVPPNDGTVAVDETELAGAKDHIVLPVSHTALLFSPGVAAQACHFLRHGRFRRAL
jgi:pimeloyl-ACP methyl ester carboxylesterase